MSRKNPQKNQPTNQSTTKTKTHSSHVDNKKAKPNPKPLPVTKRLSLFSITHLKPKPNQIRETNTIHLHTFVQKINTKQTKA